MSTGISSVRGKSWVFPVTALCIMLGMLLAMALKTQRQAASEGVPTRWPAVRTEFRNLRDENEKLRKDIGVYRTREEEMARQAASGMSTTKGLQRALDEAKALAGLVAVTGPGVVVTLDDSNKLPATETRKEVIEQYLVHDSDILAVTNELFNAGAEAISVNGERLIATSWIRCGGAPILVNSKPVAPPYVIRAIGNPVDLQKALELQGGGVPDWLFVLEMINIERKDSIFVSAFEGSTRFSHARPVKSSANSAGGGEQ